LQNKKQLKKTSITPKRKKHRNQKGSDAFLTNNVKIQIHGKRLQAGWGGVLCAVR
jgi:hypothetical protein